MMSPGVKFTLAVHLTLSIGWLGAVAAYMALDVAAASGDDAQTLRAAYLGMELIALRVIIPLAVASLVTGVVISLGTNAGIRMSPGGSLRRRHARAYHDQLTYALIHDDVIGCS